MWGPLSDTWIWFCNLIRFAPPPSQKSLRDKAISVAGRVTTIKDKELSKVSCPVCLNVLQAKVDSDLQMTLAVLLSLFHADDVELQWKIMQKKEQSVVHLPSLVLGVGMAAGFVALVAASAKNQPRHLNVGRK